MKGCTITIKKGKDRINIFYMGEKLGHIELSHINRTTSTTLLLEFNKSIDIRRSKESSLIIDENEESRFNKEEFNK